jgi:serine/threonine protein kinase
MSAVVFGLEGSMPIQSEHAILARHEILEKLGEGGVGVVYKARDTSLDRLVALKFLKPGSEASLETQNRFVDEARAIAALNHPNIATIYEIGATADGPVLVLEYLPGGTLSVAPIPIRPQGTP